MLSGRAPYVRAFITEAREEFDRIGEIHLFNNKAEEIFPPRDPHIAIPIEDETLKKYLNKTVLNIKKQAIRLIIHSGTELSCLNAVF